MRKTNELIELLFRIYTTNGWQEIEEYFEVAYALLIFHGATFIDLDDIKHQVYEEIKSGIWVANEDKHPSYQESISRLKEKVYVAIDSSEEVYQLSKLSDSEEGFREFINAGPDTLEYFTSICNKFITFKY